MAKKTRGASAASSKKQTKAAQRELKKKQRENKKKLEQQTKAASKLRRVIKTYDENSHKSDRAYIVEMLDANPAWVAKLAMVIRQGGMKILIDLETKGENDSNALDYGPALEGQECEDVLEAAHGRIASHDPGHASQGNEDAGHDGRVVGGGLPVPVPRY